MLYLLHTLRKAKSGEILEPHYKLVSSVYRYLRSGEIDKEIAMNYLKMSMCFDTKIEIEAKQDPEKSEVYSACLSTLAKIRSSDKRSGTIVLPIE